jgi:hypothetical protein
MRTGPVSGPQSDIPDHPISLVIIWYCDPVGTKRKPTLYSITQRDNSIGAPGYQPDAFQPRWVAFQLRPRRSKPGQGLRHFCSDTHSFTCLG